MTAHPAPTPLEAGRLRDAVRAFGVMSGGPAIGLILALASIWLVARGVWTGVAPPWPAVAGVTVFVVYLVELRPWSRRWGATSVEVRQPLPGDELVPRPGIQMTRAVTIDAPVERVWPWLAQIGQDRGGFYSYDWLENLAGCRLRNADRIHPEWQHRTVGETVLLHPANGVALARFEENRSFAFEGGWYFTLEPRPGGDTRLLARTRVPRGLASIAYSIFIELPHFIMERRMLLGIKQRAENPERYPAIEDGSESRTGLASTTANQSPSLNQP